MGWVTGFISQKPPRRSHAAETRATEGSVLELTLRQKGLFSPSVGQAVAGARGGLDEGSCAGGDTWLATAPGQTPPLGVTPSISELLTRKLP